MGMGCGWDGWLVDRMVSGWMDGWISANSPLLFSLSTSPHLPPFPKNISKLSHFHKPHSHDTRYPFPFICPLSAVHYLHYTTNHIPPSPFSLFQLPPSLIPPNPPPLPSLIARIRIRLKTLCPMWKGGSNREDTKRTAPRCHCRWLLPPGRRAKCMCW